MRQWSRTPARWAREPPELLTCQRHAPPPLTRRFGHTRRHPGKRGFRVGSLGRISSPGAAFCATRGQLIKKWVRNKEGTGLAVCSQPSVECRPLIPARNEPPRLRRGGFSNRDRSCPSLSRACGRQNPEAKPPPGRASSGGLGHWLRLLFDGAFGGIEQWRNRIPPLGAANAAPVGIG